MKKHTLFCLLLICCISCQKYLDERPDKALVIPQRLEDLQAMLDYNNFVNLFPRGMSEGSSDNIWLSNSDYASINESQRNIYLWADDIFLTDYTNQWSMMYDVVAKANYVLENISKIDPKTYLAVDRNNLEGSALFLRAFIYHNVAIGWTKQYDSTTAVTDLGVPLRLVFDFTAPTVRASVKDSYKQILKDLHAAVPLLQVTPKHVMRPSKVAAYALLSRVYLSMRDYENAGLYADSCLQLFPTLMDYNSSNAALAYPFQAFNPEVIYHQQGSITVVLNTVARVDSVLYASYVPNDLRRSLFFKTNTNGTIGFRGNYTESINLFAGIASDELYLVSAECLARKGNTAAALNRLNTLLKKRWKTGTFTDVTAPDANAALVKILAERRKELLIRELRWMDLKRLNKEPQFQTTLKRVINGQTYTLPPNDPRYALPLPFYVIQYSGMPQNPR